MNQEQDSRSGGRKKLLTGSFMTRMVAIALFVGLGTFAVFQSVLGDRAKARQLAQAGAESGAASSTTSSTESPPEATVDVASLNLAANPGQLPVSLNGSSADAGTPPAATAPGLQPRPMVQSDSSSSRSLPDPPSALTAPAGSRSGFTIPSTQPDPGGIRGAPSAEPARPMDTPVRVSLASDDQPATDEAAAPAPETDTPIRLPNLSRPRELPSGNANSPPSNSNSPPGNSNSPPGTGTSPSDIPPSRNVSPFSSPGTVSEPRGGLSAPPANPLATAPGPLPVTTPTPSPVAEEPTGTPPGRPRVAFGGAEQDSEPSPTLPPTQPIVQRPPVNALANPEPPPPAPAPTSFAAQPSQNLTPLTAPPPGTIPGNTPAQPVSSSSGFPGPPGAGRTVLPGAAPMTNATSATPPVDARLEGAQTPALTVQKIAPPEIQLNTPAEFRIVVRNTGRVPASEVRVLDRVPAGARLLQSDPAPDPGSTAESLAWSLGELQPGEEKTIRLQIRPERPGEIGSVAQVTFATQAAARTRVTRPQLSVQHSAPPQAVIGSTIPLRITVRNDGDGPATNVLIQEKVPDLLRYADGIRDLEYEIGTLRPGQSREVTLSLQAVAMGRAQNIVAAVADGGLQATHELPLEVISPQLAATSNGPHRRFLKRSASHSFAIINNGTAPATNVDLVAKLPRNLRFVATNNRGQYDPGSHAVYWSLSELRPGQSAEVNLDTEPIETGSAQIEFVARADLNQQAATQHLIQIDHLVDVHFELDDLTDHIETGAATEYRLRIVNQGTRPATNIRLRAELAPGLRPETVQGGLTGTAAGQQVIFEPIANLNPGEEIVATFSAIGTAPGEHRVAVNLQTDGREINITKEESTRVYSDR